MRSFFFIYTVTGVLSLILLNNLRVHAQPVISCDIPQYDFGKIYDDKDIVYSFQVTNTGETPLRISSVGSCCGTTTTFHDTNRDIQFGEKVEVGIKIISKGKIGRISKTINVASNDLKHPYYQLTISGEVIPLVSCTPSAVIFNNTREESTLSQTTIIHAFSSETLPTNSTSNVKWLRTEMNSKENETLLTIATVPPLPKNKTIAEISLLNRSGYTTQISVTIFPYQPVLISPKELVILPNLASKEIAARHFLIKSSNYKSFSIKGISCPSPKWEIASTQISTNAWRVCIDKLNSDLVIAGSTIDIITDMPEAFLISIPVTIINSSTVPSRKAKKNP